MSSRAAPPLHALQLGKGWFPEEPGGLNRIYYGLLRYLPQSGVTAHGLVAGTSRVNLESDQRVRAFALPTAPMLIRWRALRQELHQTLSEQRPDLVASHFALYTFPVLDVIRSYSLVIHFHGPWASEGQVEGDRRLNTLYKTLMERIVYRRGACFTVLSSAFRDILHCNYKVPAERIWVVPGGVDVDQFATNLTQWEAREQLDWPKDRPIVLVVRRLVRRMGLEDVIVAVDEVRRRVPEVLLLVAGKGPLAEQLSDRVQSLGLENNVRFLGFVRNQDLPMIYRAANLTVVPTQALEGFGLTTVESMSAGTPVLVTPVGGLPEVVRDLSPDMVLPGTGAETLAEGLLATLTGSLNLPGEKACEAYVRARYDWSVVTPRVRDVYAAAL